MTFFRLLPLVILVGLLLLVLQYCDRRAPGEAAARRYCGNCHLFPEPELLPKRIWDQGVLPAMKPLLGLGKDEQHPYADLSLEESMYLESAHYFPEQPLLSEAEWEEIRQFYLTQAPDSLAPSEGRRPPRRLEDRFEFRPIKGLSRLPATTLVKYFPAEKHLLTGFQDGRMLVLDENFQVRDSLKFASAVSDIVHQDGRWYVAEMGNLNPSDIYQGVIWSFDGDFSGRNNWVDQLNRPAEIQWADLAGDGSEELFICEFGHRLGSFSWVEADGKRRFTLSNAPGARTAVVTDLDKDGLRDLVVLFAQGNECVRFFRNQGNGRFQQKDLLRFPAVHGAGYLELADIDGDGHDDIIIANGDNADYSVTFKPWHGVRIYRNDGRQQFAEAWFYPMNGASKTLTRDFDGDGYLDMAAISYFPDLQRRPEESFLYFENQGELLFDSYGSAKTAVGRWLVMDAADLDGDGREDLLLGSCTTSMRLAGAEVYARNWLEENISVLVLRTR